MGVKVMRRIWTTLFAVAAFSTPALSQNYNQFVAFGDSTIDTGWFAQLTKDIPPLGAPGNTAGGTGNAGFDFVERTAVSLGGNTHSTGPGPGNAQILAGFFGLTANPANSPAGGTNYAISGATDSVNFGVTNIEELVAGWTNIGQLPSTAQQI